MKKNGTRSGTTTIYNRILDLTKQGKKVREIASIVGIPKSTVHRWMQKNKVGQESPGYDGTKFEIHNYQANVKILETPIGWKPNTILSFKKVLFDDKDQHGWTKYIFKYNDCSIHITPYSVLIFPPKIQSKISPYDVKTMASQLVIDMIPRIENLLEIKLSNRPSYYIDITKQHIAMLNDHIWDIFKKEGFRKTIDKKGNIRLILDQSKGDKHIEAIDSKYAEFDMNEFEKFIAQGATGGYNLADMKRSIITNQKAIINITKQKVPQEEEIINNEETPPYIN